ncbi:MAG: hypothetical protein COA47_12915 [Robiginitomaculum sp.]|nr:MAG: hypothetical protein COA47_12915 [Robiginitomaculum sp.]
MASEQANILDFEAASRVRMLERVRSLTLTRDALVETARQNHAIMAQVHGAVLDIIAADDWVALDHRLQHRVRTTLNADFLGLWVEGTTLPKDLSGIQVRPEGFVAELMHGQFEYLGPVSPQSEVLYKNRAAEMQSEALIRLDWGPGEALLAFAAKDRYAYGAGQGTELISFFARAVERVISHWAR